MNHWRKHKLQHLHLSVAAARLMSKQLQWIQDIEVGTGQILLPYGMPDKQYQKEAV